MAKSPISIEVADHLWEARVNGDKEAYAITSQKALESSTYPLSIVQEVILSALFLVGQRFEM